MALYAPAGPALTVAERATVDRIEAHVDTVLRHFGPATAQPRVISLCEEPAPAVARELERRYLFAGWSRVVVGRRHAGPFIELHALVSVQLSGRPTE